MFKAPTTLPMGSVSSGTPLTKVLSLMATVRRIPPAKVAVSSTTHPLAFVQKGSVTPGAARPHQVGALEKSRLRAKDAGVGR